MIEGEKKKEEEGGGRDEEEEGVRRRRKESSDKPLSREAIRWDTAAVLSRQEDGEQEVKTRKRPLLNLIMVLLASVVHSSGNSLKRTQYTQNNNNRLSI